MSYFVIPTPRFLADVEFYRVKKKYRKIDDDISEVVSALESGDLLGNEISGLKLPDNQSSYKVRVANTSANVGKSNGFRLIYYVVKDDCEIYLLTIYSKKDMENIPNDEIIELIKTFCA